MHKVRMYICYAYENLFHKQSVLFHILSRINVDFMNIVANRLLVIMVSNKPIFKLKTIGVNNNIRSITVFGIKIVLHSIEIQVFVH